MIREINTDIITQNVKEMCIEANHFLSKDMDEILKKATSNEKSQLGQKILNQLQDNLRIAGEEMIPICQDTGMAVFFVVSKRRISTAFFWSSVNSIADVIYAVPMFLYSFTLSIK